MNFFKMGGLLTSQIPEAEKLRWTQPHELGYNYDLRKKQLALLPNFGNQLRICYIDNSFYGVKYQHWYVTDNEYVIEFGGGDMDNIRYLITAGQGVQSAVVST